jgi:predicted  nucleic acid-binding Zn-ribbon protein
MSIQVEYIEPCIKQENLPTTFCLVEQGVCTACFIKIPEKLLQVLRLDPYLKVRCPSCLAPLSLSQNEAERFCA